MPTHCLKPAILPEGLTAILDHLGVGIALLQPEQQLVYCNAAARSLLGMTPGDHCLPQIDGVAVEVGLAVNTALMTGPSGTALKLVATPLRSGLTLLVVETSAEESGAARTLFETESGYSSLFDNAVCGIYRDRPDGTPVRANRALAVLNGYASEEKFLRGVSSTSVNWYVDPGRAAQFKQLINAQGGVRDFVSEVYRHRSREKFWITENAWYVRDAAGNAIYIEGTIQDATERVLGVAAIERQANTDQLTGAASRFHFMNKLNALTKDQGSAGVLFSIDLDKFKEVNDQMGHGAGDAVLKSVAARLRRIGGPEATVARLGGDEFAMIISGSAAPMKADMTAAEIVRALRAPVEISGYSANVGASVGVALYPAHAATANELLNHSDLALYHVKANGRNSFCIFNPEMKIRQQRRKALEDDLREAISGNALELYYQPIVATKTTATVGYEALMRWNHPRRGFLPPSQFIAVAEEAGLMTELGNWAILRACRQIVLLPDHVTIAVNVSPSQFRSSGIVDTVKQALADTGLAPPRLTLEVTETVILSGEAQASRVIDELLALGVKLALDDFGTGYSSLSYLQRFAFSKVKIDRSFVAGIETKPANLAIIRAIIHLAKDLGMDVVAEGIETESQAAILRTENCGLLQGYLYGKPMPYREIVANQAVHNLRSYLPARPAQSQPVETMKRTVNNAL